MAMSHAVVPATAIIIDVCWSILQGESNLLNMVKSTELNAIDIEVIMGTWNSTRDLLCQRLLTYVGDSKNLVTHLEVVCQHQTHVYLAIKY